MRVTRCEAGARDGSVLSYSGYFKGITQVISRDGYGLLVDATARRLARDVVLSDIQEILIYAEKHGSDYHPARIEVMVDGVCATFVMNVAVSARGKARLCSEFDVLQHLGRKYGFSFLPQAYFYGEASCGSGHNGEADTSLPMFLADWFEGYHEFHLSVDKEDGSQRLVLWDTDKGHYHLRPSHSSQIYRQAARILTLYYDVETFEQIFPWHHAAGDFIVKAAEESLDVRLVTARQYGSMMDRSEGVSAHEGLLFFLLNLSLRMRLDRLDGVGAVVWADDGCLDDTLQGFLEGLRVHERKGMIDTGFVEDFVKQCGSVTKGDLSERFHALIDACDQAAPDMPVIRGHLKRHISRFHSAFQGLEDSRFLTTTRPKTSL
ncbi:MAG: hypothetical protein KAT27_02340 [Desulfobacterales bacterium]|nr:hypothetical protein [Desulfobacterales bacterium]